MLKEKKRKKKGGGSVSRNYVKVSRFHWVIFAIFHANDLKLTKRQDFFEFSAQ